MKLLYQIYMLSGLLYASACSPTVRVYTDYDRDVQISNYTTYSWMSVRDIELKNNPLLYNELNDKRIKEAVNKELDEKGYKRLDANADFIMHYHIVVEDKTAVRTDPYGYYYGPYWTRSRVNVYPYREGTLIIDLMDVKTNNLAWRGWAVAVLEGNISDPETRTAMIQSAVHKIFEAYPYTAKR
jgi:hypothetical protein